MKKSPVGKFPSIRQMIVESALDELNEDWEGRSSEARSARTNGRGKNHGAGVDRRFENQFDFDETRMKALGGDPNDMFRKKMDLSPSREFREDDALEWSMNRKLLKRISMDLEPIYARAEYLLRRYEKRNHDMGMFRDDIEKNRVSKEISSRYDQVGGILSDLVDVIEGLDDFLDGTYGLEL